LGTGGATVKVLTRSRLADGVWPMVIALSVLVISIPAWRFPPGFPPPYADAGAWVPALLLAVLSVERFAIFAGTRRNGRRESADGSAPIADLPVGVVTMAVAALWGWGLLSPPASPLYGDLLGSAVILLSVFNYCFTGRRLLL
jgi:hypothetical protein